MAEFHAALGENNKFYDVLLKIFKKKIKRKKVQEGDDDDEDEEEEDEDEDDFERRTRRRRRRRARRMRPSAVRQGVRAAREAARAGGGVHRVPEGR